MKLVTAVGEYVICVFRKNEEIKKGVLIVPEEKKAKIYSVYDAGSSKRVKDNDKVFLTGYAQPLEIDSETYYIVKEEHIGAIVQA